MITYTYHFTLFFIYIQLIRIKFLQKKKKVFCESRQFSDICALYFYTYHCKLFDRWIHHWN